MSRIEVAPHVLTDTADRLRAATLDAQRVGRSLRDAGPSVTGSAALTDALREHAETWGPTLDRAHQRVGVAARALDEAAAAYDCTEQAVSDAAH